MNLPPRAPDPSETQDRDSSWSERDRAMHGLLEALLPTPDGTGRLGDSSSGRHLARFVEGEGLPAPSMIGRELAVGESLGRFRIEEEIGRGGFGVVYRAIDTRLGRAVAVKVPRPDRVQSVALWDRFAHEARLAGALDHAAIVPVLDAGIIDGIICVVSAYQKGETLSRWLATRYPSGMPAKRAATLAARIASGLSHAHQRGILHRDLKPGNVLMVPHEPGASFPQEDGGVLDLPPCGSGRPRGGRVGGTPSDQREKETIPSLDRGADHWSARITDFGLGTIEAEHTSQTLTGYWQGSPPYMAPEQVLPNLGRVDARSDVYALGAILYEMLTGRPLYACASIMELSLALGKGEPPIRPRHLCHDIPRDLETIVLTSLERAPSRRYPTAAAVHEDLTRFLAGRPIFARPLSAPQRLGRWIKRRPSQAALMALALVATVFTTGLVVRHRRQLSSKDVELSRSNDQFKSTVTQRDAANTELKSTLDRLQASERTSRRTAFSADLRLAERELGAGRVELVQTLLRRYEPAPSNCFLPGEQGPERGRRVPAPDTEDLRDFTWHYLMRQARRSHTIHPLKDLAWWRGPRPLTPALESMDPETRKAVLDHLGDCVFDRDGIRHIDGDLTYFLDGGFMGFLHPDSDGPSRENLLYLDGRRRLPLGLPRRWHGLGPGGKTLVLIDPERRAKNGESPALIRRAPLMLPDRQAGKGTEGEKSSPSTHPPLQVVELVTCETLRFSDDGQTLACLAWFYSGDSVTHVPTIYDLRSDWRASYPEHARPSHIELSASGPAGDRGQVRVRLALSPDGRLAALTGNDPRVLVFETRTGKPVWSLDAKTFGETVVPTSLMFSPDRSALVTGDSGGDVKVWDARTGALVNQSPVNVGYVASVGFHPDSRTVAIIARNEDAIRFWNYAPKPEPPTLLDHGDEVWGLAFSDRGETLISAGDDNKVKAWSLTDGDLARTMLCDSLPSALAVNPTGTHVAVGRFSGITFRRRATFSKASQGVYRGLTGTKIRAVAFSPDGQTVVAGGNAPGVLVGTGTGKDTRERLVDTPHEGIHGLAFSPDGKTLAMGSHNHVITLWDVPEFRHRATLLARGRVTCVAYAPDGKMLVSGDTEGGLQLWDTTSDTLHTTVERASETGGVWSLSFSPDGKTLATGGDDGMVRLWDPDLAVERLALAGHEAKVHAVTFTPDGKTLASGDFAGKIRLWRAGP